MKYAARINSFLSKGVDIKEAIKAIGTVDGITYVDLNYPEHFQKYSPEEIYACLKENGLKLNAIATRYRNEFINGVFTNPDEDIARDAMLLTKQAIQYCERMHGNHVIVWLSYDGFDYPFQMDYIKAWDVLVNCFRELCDFSSVPVSIEYKPTEERGHALLDSYATTRDLIREIGKDNIGITVDYCHALMIHESPALVVAMALRDKLLLSMHLNDGEGVIDNGLMCASLSLSKTLETFFYLKKYEFDGVLYFDTFPKRENCIDELTANVQMCKKIESLLTKERMKEMQEIIGSTDATRVVRMLTSILA